MPIPDKVIRVHNVWTIYGMNPDGTEAETPFAQTSRPQDWGHPRWYYERYQFRMYEGRTVYINHCHCWTDLKRPRSEYPRLFATLIVLVMMPGTDPKLCDRRFIGPDDFWDRAWGKLPPEYDPATEGGIEAAF